MKQRRGSSGGMAPGLGKYRTAIGSITEDPPAAGAEAAAKAKKTAKARRAKQLAKCGQQLEEVKETYAKLAAKARGVNCHPAPPELLPARDPRDCTEWLRQDKLYSPYTPLDRTDPMPEAPRPKACRVPPPLWLPDPRGGSPTGGCRRAGPSWHGPDDGMRLGAEAGEDGADLDPGTPEAARSQGESLLNRPPWDGGHHVMFSRLNNEVQMNCREYFDRPVRLEGDGIPKVREQHVMHDRQCGWNDEPAAPGESRRTLYDCIGPVNRGGCKEQQLPSYWRGVKDWRSYSAPDLAPLSLAREGRPAEKGDKASSDKAELCRLLADTPADHAKAFWRGWAEGKSPQGSLPRKSGTLAAPRGWDGRFHVCWSRANEICNFRSREYFSVPKDGPGTATEPPRPRRARLPRVA